MIEAVVGGAKGDIALDNLDIISKNCSEFEFEFENGNYFEF
jgi:hypothetical protein